MLQPLLSLLLPAVLQANNGCCEPCQDCLMQVDTLQTHNSIFAPITIGTGFFDYTAFPNGQASSTGTDGWFNSTSASPYAIRSNEVFGLLTGCHEFVAEAVLTFSSQLLVGSATSPLGYHQDPQYGAGIFGLLGEDDGWTFAFVLTNARVFAMIRYLRTDPPILTDNVRSFTYLIPVRCRKPKDINQYRLVLRPAQQALWFSIDSIDVLRVCHPGRPPMSEAFLVAEGGSTPQNGFPEAVRVLLGLMTQPRGWPHGACQQYIFDQDKQSLYDPSSGCTCEYAPYQDPSEYLTGLKLRYFELQVLQTFCGQDCPGPCCPGCDYNSNECNIPGHDSSSSSCAPARRHRHHSSSSSSSSHDCNPVRRPSQSSFSSLCDRSQGDWRNRQLQMTPLVHSDSSYDYPTGSSSKPDWQHKPTVRAAAWLGHHAREARRKKPCGKPRARLVTYDYIWPN